MNGAPSPERPPRPDGFTNGSIASTYVTADAPPIGGVLRTVPEDFLVEEIPLYHPAGEGEHLYLMVEKQEMSTFEMLDLVASHFEVKPQAVGFAGLKDKHAITRQVVSIHAPGRTPEDFPMLAHERVRVLWADLHTHKLRRGHLRGNRFSIRVRGVSPNAALQASRQLEALSQTGVPNRLGPQRFGHLGNNHRIGLALVLGDHRAFLDELLGPNEAHPEPQAEARRAYAEGRFREALDGFPRFLRAEGQALGALARGANAKRAVKSIDRRARAFYLSSFQSALFNRVLDERVDAGTWDTALDGDILMRHADREERLINAHSLEEALASCRSLESSPTGPMWGGRMPRCEGPSDAMELAALDSVGLDRERLEAFARESGEVFAGSRRPLRVPVTDQQVEGGADAHGMYLRCAFDLPRGSFATVVMDELMKNGAPDATTERQSARGDRA